MDILSRLSYFLQLDQLQTNKQSEKRIKKVTERERDKSSKVYYERDAWKRILI